jgi:hypothetical protein
MMARSAAAVFHPGVNPMSIVGHLVTAPYDANTAANCAARAVLLQCFMHCDAFIVRTYLQQHFGDVLGNPSLLDNVTCDDMFKYFEKLERDGVGDGKALKFVTGEELASLSVSAESTSHTSKTRKQERKEAQRKRRQEQKNDLNSVSGPNGAYSVQGDSKKPREKKKPAAEEAGDEQVKRREASVAARAFLEQLVDAMKKESNVEAQDKLVSKFFDKSVEIFGKNTISSWCTGQMQVGSDFFIAGKDWWDVKDTKGYYAMQKLMWLVKDIFNGPNSKVARIKPYQGVPDAQEVFSTWRSKSPLVKHLVSSNQQKKKVSFKTNPKYAALSMSN